MGTLDDLRGLVVFSEVVEGKSFARAAVRLGMTRSAVSKHLAQLEEQLGVQLLVRTTRKLALTEVGERVYRASASMRESAELAREAARTHQGVVEGVLRITAPAALGRRYLVPIARDLLALHPRLELSLLLSDGYLDLLEQRIDVALRVGRFQDSSLVARKIAPVGLLFCAAPSYLERHGTPRRPSELAHHQCLVHLPSSAAARLELRKGRKVEEVRLGGRLACDDGAGCVEAALAGVGIVSAPEFEVSEEVRAGKLVRVLVGWTTPALTLYTVTPPRRHVSSKTRTFLDFMQQRWERPPWRLGPPHSAS